MLLMIYTMRERDGIFFLRADDYSIIISLLFSSVMISKSDAILCRLLRRIIAVVAERLDICYEIPAFRDTPVEARFVLMSNAT